MRTQASRPVHSAILVLTVIVLVAACVGGCSPKEPPFHSGNNDRLLDVGGQLRRYIFYVPPSHVPSEPSPLVMVFHGAGGSADGAAYGSGFSQLADREGFLVVYPEGVGKYWNDWRDAAPGQPDDPAFVGALVRRLEKDFSIDPIRIFAVGYSNGAFLTHRLAFDLPGLFAAIAPVAGTARGALVDRNPPWWPVSVVMVHGTRDSSVPWDGQGEGRSRMLSVPDTVALWVGVNGCDNEPEISQMEDSGWAWEIRVERYGGGRDGSEVLLYALVGAGHDWPSITSVGAEPSYGSPPVDSWAAELIWEFFSEHPAGGVRERLWVSGGGG